MTGAGIEEGEARRGHGGLLLSRCAQLDWDVRIRQVEKTVGRVGLEKVMFELPGPWISGVTFHEIHRMRRELIDRYGVEVNIGNVLPDDAMTLEAYRRQLGVNAGAVEET